MQTHPESRKARNGSRMRRDHYHHYVANETAVNSVEMWERSARTYPRMVKSKYYYVQSTLPRYVSVHRLKMTKKEAGVPARAFFPSNLLCINLVVLLVYIDIM